MKLDMKQLVRAEIAQLNLKIEALFHEKKTHTKKYRALTKDHKHLLSLIGYGS